MLKLIHAADFHLDAPFAALPPERAAERREALVSGETDVLEELEQERLLLDHRENPGFRTIPLWDNEWAKIATANTI